MVIGLRLTPDELDNTVDLIVRGVAAKNAPRGEPSVLEEHVAVSEQSLGAGLIEDDTRVDALREAARLGIAKINIETDLNLVMTACIRQFFIEHPDAFDPQKYLGPGRRAIRSMVIHKMRHVLGCSHGGLG